MGQTPRVIAAGALVACGLTLAACGSTGTVTVPPTGGLGVIKAVVQLCQADLRIRGAVYVPGTSAPQVSYALPVTYAEAAQLRRAKPLVVIATVPPAGTKVVAGSAVALTLARAQGHWDISVPSARCSAPAGSPTLTPATAERLAQRTAASSLVSSGAHGAVHGWFVQTTRQAANSLTSGDGVDSDQPVVLVELRGTFSPPAIPGAKGISGLQAAQTWHTAIFIVDAATGRVTDSGLDNSNPVLSVLGVVGTLPVLHAPAQTSG